MPAVTFHRMKYTVDPLYQWDLNQVLEIRGLSLPSSPKIHFANGSASTALIPETKVDAEGVITAEIPNILLQSASKIMAYVCVWEGDTFRTLYSVEIPVKARAKPADYVYVETEVLRYEYLEIRTLADAEIELLNTILVDGTAISQPEMRAAYVTGWEEPSNPDELLMYHCNVTAAIANIDKVFIKKAEVGFVKRMDTIVEYEWHDAEIVFGDTEHTATYSVKTQYVTPYSGILVKLTYYSLIGGINEMTVEAVSE